MAGAKKPKIEVGKMLCPMCLHEGVKTEIRVKQNFDRTGALSYPCSQRCDNPGWALQGTKAYDNVIRMMGSTWLPPKATRDELPPVKDLPETKPEPAPAPAKKSSGFFG